MKILGRGWQYTTYDLKKGRVIKKFNSRFVSYAMMFHDCFPYYEYKPWYFERYYKKLQKEARDSLHFIKNSSIDPALFGNVSILEDGITYEQNKLIPVSHFLKNASYEETKNTINNFVEFVTLLLNHGIFDKALKFGLNFGIDTQGRIVLMDVGELYTNPEVIKKKLQERPWQRHKLRFINFDELKKYYREEMDRHISPFINVL